jgi:type III secretion protein D
MNAPYASLDVENAATARSSERVLRVLTGRLAGAEHRLRTGRFVRLGHSFDHDVVLRGSATAGASVELHVLDQSASIKVVAGTIKFLGRSMQAGDDAQLPMFVPFSVGEFSVAIGEADSDRWADAKALVTTNAAPTDVNVSHDGLVSPAVAEPATALQRVEMRLTPLRNQINIEKHWPKYAAVAAAVLLIFAAMAPVYNWANNEFRGPDQARNTLVAAGFKGLTVKRNPDTEVLVVSGTMRTDKDVSKLRSFAASTLSDAIIEVNSTEAHAAAATEILNAQGIKGTVEPIKTGVLLVKAEFLAQDKQAEIVTLLKRDLPAVQKVLFNEDKGLGDRDLQYFFSSGEYGLATFVDGDPTYIVTADGTRWFTGAKVPTGHTIVSMGNRRIRFERDGRVDELVL